MSIIIPLKKSRKNWVPSASVCSGSGCRMPLNQHITVTLTPARTDRWVGWGIATWIAWRIWARTHRWVGWGIVTWLAWWVGWGIGTWIAWWVGWGIATWIARRIWARTAKWVGWGGLVISSLLSFGVLCEKYEKLRYSNSFPHLYLLFSLFFFFSSSLFSSFSLCQPCMSWVYHISRVGTLTLKFTPSNDPDTASHTLSNLILLFQPHLNKAKWQSVTIAQWLNVWWLCWIHTSPPPMIPAHMAWNISIIIQCTTPPRQNWSIP